MEVKKKRVRERKVEKLKWRDGLVGKEMRNEGYSEGRVIE